MMKWNKINDDDKSDTVPKNSNNVLIYNKGDDEVVAGYLWRGDNLRDYNPSGPIWHWMPRNGDNVIYWEPTHWMDWPEKPE